MCQRTRVLAAALILATGVAGHAQTIATLKGHKHTITSLAWAPDGKTLASGAKDETVILWDLAEKKPRAVLGGHKDMVITVRFSPDSKTLASVSHDSLILLWNAADGKRIGELKGHNKDVATGGIDRNITLWNVRKILDVHKTK